MNFSLKLISNIYPISSKSSEQLSSTFKKDSFSKGDLIIKKAKPNNKEYLVLSGICRSYVLDPEGREISLSFYTEGNPISPNITRTKNYLSTLNVEALSDVELVSFSSEKLGEFMSSNMEIRQWGNFVLQKELMEKVEKELSQASMTAEERLLNFRQKYPTLENQISHPIIASYLGITNISLSRLRTKLKE